MSRHLALAALAGLVASCAGSLPAKRTPKADCVWTESGAPGADLCRAVERGDLRVAIRRAQAAARYLDAMLSADVVLAVERLGAANAVGHHADKAPRATELASLSWGVALGRASARPRNPQNVPPAWAEPFVKEWSGRRAVDVPSVAVDLENGAVGVLMPVRVRASCLACHGTERYLAAGVQRELDRYYPRDRATGYLPDEHLGFVWAVSTIGERAPAAAGGPRTAHR